MGKNYLPLLVLSAVAMFTMIFSYMVGDYMMQEDGPIVYVAIAFGVTGISVVALIYALIRAIVSGFDY
jgi:hypothetical protein